MSVLQTPRILFKGSISWDPIVTNNYDTFYDEDADETVFPTAADRVAAFRQKAIDAVSTIGNWNPHGTYRSSFYDAAVSGVDLGSGLTTDDPFVKSNASLKGMLVDLEPFGAFTSQLFFDNIQFGVDGGYSLFCERRWRMTARYINFARNSANAMIAGVASVVWQTSFPSELVHIDSFDSKALQTLATAMAAPGVLGLTVRFNAYRTVYFDNLRLTNKSRLTARESKALQKKLRAGGFQPNPARSLLVGVIGLWRQGEPVHEPGDRALLPAAQGLGTAHARVDGTTLTIDLSNSIPMISKRCTVANLGTLTIEAVDPTSGSCTALGPIPYSAYNKAAFGASSGIVTLPLSQTQAAAATTGNLQLLDGNNKTQLIEAPLRAVPVTPNQYIEYDGTADLAFQVYERGRPAQKPCPLTLYQMDASGSKVTHTTNATTGASGLYTFPVSGTSGGSPPPDRNTPGTVIAYVAAPDSSQAPGSGGINPLVNTYAYLRILAADEEVAALPPTWDNVYQQVLANWNAMAPCMDNWLMLNDPERVRAYRVLIEQLTDPSAFENYRYMPITRDLSAGCRRLLYNFLDAPEVMLEAAAARVQTGEPEAEADYAKLSQAMRRPQLGASR